MHPAKIKMSAQSRILTRIITGCILDNQGATDPIEPQADLSAHVSSFTVLISVHMSAGSLF